MRPIRVSFTVRGLLIAIALVGLNLAAALTTSQHYPRPYFLPAGIYGGGSRTVTQEDGTEIYYRRASRDKGPNLMSFDRPQVTGPPRPSFLRIWSPVLISVAISLLILYAAVSRNRLPRMSMRRGAFLLAASASAVWLAVPLIRIMNNPAEDYHTHEGFGIGFPPLGYVPPRVHVNPFWPRYGRLLLGRPWPGDYVCPAPARPSLSLPRGTPLEIDF